VGSTRPLVYQARIPLDWERIDPAAGESIQDSTLALVEYRFEGGEIFVHNFPADSLEARIPPDAQLARWLRQLGVRREDAQIRPVAWGGFSGLHLSAQGMVEGQAVHFEAWAMQMKADHFLALMRPSSPDDLERYRQMRADFTLKAVGSPENMLGELDTIRRFATSFELIDEIPRRP
jgi:hypothetical protein